MVSPSPSAIPASGATAPDAVDKDATVTLFMYHPLLSDLRDAPNSGCSERQRQTPTDGPACALVQKSAGTHHFGKRLPASNLIRPVHHARQPARAMPFSTWPAGYLG